MFRQIISLLSNIKPGSNKISQDINDMRVDLEPLTKDLIPWSDKDSELLSFNQENRVENDGFVKSVKGQFVSIYHEPMFAYSFKKYYSSGLNALMYIKTSEFEFLYRIRNEGIDIIINKTIIGRLNHDGLFYGAKSKRLEARINRNVSPRMRNIILGSKEAGSIMIPEEGTKELSRAFQYVAELTRTELAYFMALSLFEMVKTELPEKFKK